MTVVRITLGDYTLNLQQMTDLADQWYGKRLNATVAMDGSGEAEWGFESPGAAADARAFRKALDTCFRRKAATDTDSQAAA